MSMRTSDAVAISIVIYNHSRAACGAVCLHSNAGHIGQCRGRPVDSPFGAVWTRPMEKPGTDKPPPPFPQPLPTLCPPPCPAGPVPAARVRSALKNPTNLFKKRPDYGFVSHPQWSQIYVLTPGGRFYLIMVRGTPSARQWIFQLRDPRRSAGYSSPRPA